MYPKLFRPCLVCVFVCLLGCVSPTFSAPHEDWTEIKSAHVTVYCNAGAREGRRVAAAFEEIRAALEQNLPDLRRPTGKPTIVFAVKDENSLKMLLPPHTGTGDGLRAAGYYHATYDRDYFVIRSDLAASEAHPYHIVFHEYAHGLFRANYRNLPLWLNEGLAEFWGTSEIRDREARFGLTNEHQLQLLRDGPMLPLITLLTTDAGSPLYGGRDRSGIFYAQSWLLVHYLSMAPALREKNLLKKYLEVWRQSGDSVEAAQEAFGDLKKLERSLDNYAHLNAIPFQRTQFADPIPDQRFQTRQMEPPEAMLHLAEYLQRANRLPQSAALLLQAGDRDPAVPGLHRALGYNALFQSDFETAAKECAKAAQTDPADAANYICLASVLYKRSGYNADTTPLIIENLEKATALQPDFVPSLTLLCMAYLASSDQKKNAISAAARALELEPANPDLLLDYSQALAANGEIIEAQHAAELARRSSAPHNDRGVPVIADRGASLAPNR